MPHILKQFPTRLPSEVNLLSNFTRSLLRQTTTSPKRQFNTFSLRMEHGSPIEEETLPFYKQEQFYPIKIGKILDSRYRVVGKLGYGPYSTVWLCREIKYDVQYCFMNETHTLNHRYVAVKVLTRISRSDHAMNGEMEIYSHLSKVHCSHIGGAYIRGLHDAFEIHVPEWVHQCFVHPPMQISIHELLVQAKSHKLSKDLLKQTLICLFQAMDFLHSIAGVVHSGTTLSLKTRGYA
ncbi:protein kinase domain protein [Penicillium alfredii]|uniref:non-specific serine/threonine protein kinase n=1 Tax=Penicillium alfredii TaxID=1506179 RepID=A0A9W9GC73_9EURO|nr:protein kinase domain protein [Penicillium alfredii]KAJ5115340.1 protein kinase domain protein [Penicillium alfredii]